MRPAQDNGYNILVAGTLKDAIWSGVVEFG